MQIIVQQLKKLNRYLSLGLYILVDSDRIMLMSLTEGTMLHSFSSMETLEFYNYLVELYRYVSSWSSMQLLQNCENRKVVTKSQIYQLYKFDISKHFKIKKYGEY